MKNGGTAIVGYLVYNSFDPDYDNDLIAAFKEFKDGGVTDLVLDLRYNKSGSAETAELMANLIVPPDMNGKVFADYKFNDRHSDRNRTAVLTSHTSSIGLKTVYILTSEHTAGAAELLINGFKGLDGEGEMTLVVVGDLTAGMNAGMVKRTYSTDNYQYQVYPLAFRCYNAKGEGDYQYGLSPNGGTVNEWDSDVVTKWSATWGWKGVAGATEDQLLQKALTYVVGNADIPTAKVLYANSRRKSGYPRIYSVQASMTMNVPE